MKKNREKHIIDTYKQHYKMKRSLIKGAAAGAAALLAVTAVTGGRLKFVIGEGESKQGPVPPTGNTNTRGFFRPSTKDFVKSWVMEGPTHHFALGVGHHAETIQKIAAVLGIESVIVGK